MLFVAQVACIWIYTTRLKRLVVPGTNDPFLEQLPTATRQAVLLLLFNGFFGHNLYRPHWLWIAAWVISALSIVRDGAMSRASPSGNSRELGVPRE
jgi:hypothetical protein